MKKLSLLLLFVSACSRPQPEFPIPQDKLPGVLIGIYVAQAEAEIEGTDIEDARIDVLQLHGYDTLDFNATMQLLTEEPEIAKHIYQVVLDSVIFEQREIRAKALDGDGGGRSEE